MIVIGKKSIRQSIITLLKSIFTYDKNIWASNYRILEFRLNPNEARPEEASAIFAGHSFIPLLSHANLL
jgi:hypothetical protein